jgi:hypothetical protein
MNFFKKKNKFRAKPTNGFPSKLESAVYDLLVLLERSGEISDIRRQEVVQLSNAKINYKTDFSYVETATGTKVWVEAKGFEQDVWKLKKKLWAAYGPGKLQIYKGSYIRPTLDEEIIPTNEREGAA